MHKPKERHIMDPTDLQHNTYKEHAISSKENVAHMKRERFKEAEEDDEDLFEIDLEAVDNLPPPYYWESTMTATTNTLFANCLVPRANVSSAVPMANPKNAKYTWLGLDSRSGCRVIWVRGAEPFHSFSRASSPGALSNLLQKTLIVSSSFDQGK